MLTLEQLGQVSESWMFVMREFHKNPEVQLIDRAIEIYLEASDVSKEDAFSQSIKEKSGGSG